MQFWAETAGTRPNVRRAQVWELVTFLLMGLGVVPILGPVTEMLEPEALFLVALGGAFYAVGIWPFVGGGARERFGRMSAASAQTVARPPVWRRPTTSACRRLPLTGIEASVQPPPHWSAGTSRAQFLKLSS